MNILTAIKDPNLFRPFLGDDLESWKPWFTALRCLYGLPVKSSKSRKLIRRCTARSPDELPPDGFRTALFLVGRRSGKSRIAAIVGAFEALFGGHEKRLAKGEVGILPVISPTRYQSGICWKYLKAIFDTELLRNEVVDTKEAARELTLRNGIEIQVVTGDWRTVRGFSLVAAIVDEACFFGLSEESKVRSDTELVRAIRPGLATTQGKLIGISSKYARKGFAYSTWLKQHGSNRGVSPSFVQKWTTLVWDSPSRVMNPTLSQTEIDAAFAEDPAAARSEFGGEWRDDVSEYIPRALVEALVCKGRKELSPRLIHPNVRQYVAFTDLSGGRNDDAGLAIAHKEGRKVVLDFARLWRSPFNPHLVISEQAEELRRFGLTRVTGDNYAASFVSGAFQSHGIGYRKSPLPKSELYRELLPIMCSSEIVLLDDPKLIDQISGLERRTRSGGKDVIDHPPTGHDDLANAVAGAAVECSKRTRMIGAF